jgi:hypothetical protein
MIQCNQYFEHTGCTINAHAVYAPGSQTTSPLS